MITVVMTVMIMTIMVIVVVVFVEVGAATGRGVPATHCPLGVLHVAVRAGAVATRAHGGVQAGAGVVAGGTGCLGHVNGGTRRDIVEGQVSKQIVLVIILIIITGDAPVQVGMFHLTTRTPAVVAITLRVVERWAGIVHLGTRPVEVACRARDPTSKAVGRGVTR